jgi:hypothetical protein
MATITVASPANNIICSLADAEGRVLGPPLDLPQDAGPKELQLLLNTILQTVSFFGPLSASLTFIGAAGFFLRGGGIS